MATQLKNPHGVGIDNAGNVYVADTGNGRLSAVDRDRVALTTFGSKGVLNGQFKNPWDVAIASTGDLYVADTVERPRAEAQVTIDRRHDPGRFRSGPDRACVKPRPACADGSINRCPSITN